MAGDIWKDLVNRGKGGYSRTSHDFSSIGYCSLEVWDCLEKVFLVLESGEDSMLIELLGVDPSFALLVVA